MLSLRTVLTAAYCKIYSRLQSSCWSMMWSWNWKFLDSLSNLHIEGRTMTSLSFSWTNHDASVSSKYRRHEPWFCTSNHGRMENYRGASLSNPRTPYKVIVDTMANCVELNLIYRAGDIMICAGRSWKDACQVSQIPSHISFYSFFLGESGGPSMTNEGNVFSSRCCVIRH